MNTVDPITMDDSKPLDFLHVVQSNVVWRFHAKSLVQYWHSNNDSYGYNPCTCTKMLPVEIRRACRVANLPPHDGLVVYAAFGCIVYHVAQHMSAEPNEVLGSFWGLLLVVSIAYTMPELFRL